MWITTHSTCVCGKRSRGERLESSSVQMWFSAERFLKLFDNLELPTKRAIDSKVKYKDKWDKRDSSSGGNKTVSYNKMLLISWLMYFYEVYPKPELLRYR